MQKTSWSIYLQSLMLGAISTLAFAPFNLWPIAILTLTGLIVLIAGKKIRQAALVAFYWGFGFFATGISWVYVSIASFGGLPTIANLIIISLLIAYLALYPTLFAFLSAKLSPNLSKFNYFCTIPCLFTLTEWLRGYLFTGFPWLWLGYSQTDGPLACLAPIIGSLGISFILALLSSSCAYSWLNWRKNRAKPILLALLLGTIFIVTTLVKNINWVTPSNKETSIALVQANVAQAEKWKSKNFWSILDKYLELTSNLKADLIIWPETAIPAKEQQVQYILKDLDNALQVSKQSLITGLIDYNNKNYYNQIISIGFNENNNKYNYPAARKYTKQHLLPFGEYLPFKKFFSALSPFFEQAIANFSSRKNKTTNLKAANLNLATAICYEIIFSSELRAQILPTTDAILTVSNDTWFGNSLGPIQHMQIARMRALEFARPVIRATNNGISAIVAANGKITAQLPQFKLAVLTAKITPTHGLTPFSKWGNIPLYCYMFICLILSFLFYNKKKG